MDVIATLTYRSCVVGGRTFESQILNQHFNKFRDPISSFLRGRSSLKPNPFYCGRSNLEPRTFCHKKKLANLGFENFPFCADVRYNVTVQTLSSGVRNTAQGTERVLSCLVTVRGGEGPAVEMNVRASVDVDTRALHTDIDGVSNIDSIAVLDDAVNVFTKVRPPQSLSNAT